MVRMFVGIKAHCVFRPVLSANLRALRGTRLFLKPQRFFRRRLQDLL